MKQAVIAPSMLYLLYPLQGTVDGYTREEFVADLVNEVLLDHSLEAPAHGRRLLCILVRERYPWMFRCRGEEGLH